ncbi:MAG TPA: lysophospholipid acyltransferase family protein [Jatrophihabitans sp.]|nr:lysophospholipid acyltransferase family protein [Jatrophihabitans sp.]
MTRLHKPRAGFWIRLCVIVLYPLDSLLFKLRWHHLDRMPATGGVLVAVNHISQADTATMARLIWQSGRIPRFLIKHTVFEWPVVGRVMAGAGQLPVYRGSDQAADSLRAAVAALQAGECVIIYPEGTITRNPDYTPMQARTGVARLALACPDVPVIPIGQWGAHRTLGRGGQFRPLPRHRHEASLGEPVDLAEFRGQPGSEPSAELLRAMTDRIMAAVGEQVALARTSADGHPAAERPTDQHPGDPHTAGDRPA